MSPTDKKKAILVNLLKKGKGEKPSNSPVSTKLASEVRLIAGLKRDIAKNKGIKPADLVTDRKFQKLFEANRDEAIRPLVGSTASRTSKEIKEIVSTGRSTQKVDLTRYAEEVQTALATAYRKSLEEYYRQLPRAA